MSEGIPFKIYSFLTHPAFAERYAFFKVFNPIAKQLHFFATDDSAFGFSIEVLSSLIQDELLSNNSLFKGRRNFRLFRHDGQ